jgi:galactose-1-phosphate uridylyltransferase
MTAPGAQWRITTLNMQTATLSAEDRARFQRLYRVGVTVGRTAPPEPMHPWIESHFGSVDAVREQRIIKVTNLVTLEGTLFNELRARRPLESPPEAEGLDETIRSSAGGPFCQPGQGTPADTFGRIRGQWATTASNVAKYDGWHGVIIFDEHHPLRFTAGQVADYVDTAQEWAQAAHQADPQALYPFFLWNCLWKSGASILHGHAQMTLSRGMHYAQVERWRQAARRYRAEHGADYFADLVVVHRALGLTLDHGTAIIFPTLTPFKEKETYIVAPTLDGDLKSAIHLVLSTFVERLGVQSFNLALYQPPLAGTAEDWDGFPFVVRIIDRGDLHSKTADIGAMEVFGQSVVASDPFQVATALRAFPGAAEKRHRVAQGEAP